MEADLATRQHADVLMRSSSASSPGARGRKHWLAESWLHGTTLVQQTEALQAYRDAHRACCWMRSAWSPARGSASSTRRCSARTRRWTRRRRRRFPELDPLIATPFVGRDRELAALRELWESARTGTGAIVAVTGARGSGKTRITAELASAVHRRGAVVLSAAASRAGERAVGGEAHNERSPRLLVLWVKAWRRRPRAEVQAGSRRDGDAVAGKAGAAPGGAGHDGRLSPT